MLIACLGWGSLIWKPDALPLASEWFMDGPTLPIEFSRVGDGGELATVVCANAPLCKVLWAVLDAQTLEDACAALRRREQIPEDRRDGIGVLRTSKMAVGTIDEWARARQLDAVIWTALPPRFNGMEGQVPSADEAIAYLANLTGEARDHAREYIRMTPEQIDTPYRRELARRLGWH